MANPLTGTNVLNPGGSGQPGGGVAPESVGGDSLTRTLIAMLNRGNNSGADITNAGGSLLNAGAGTTQGGLQTLEAPTNYFASILSGDPRAMAAAAAPTISAVRANYDNATRSASQLQPRGGFRSATMAELPFQKNAVVNNALLAQQPAAANSLANIGTGVAGIGLGQQQVGTQEQGLGLQQLYSILQAELARRGQNITETGQNKQLVGSLVGDTTRSLFG